jgi:CheY-like chemotaxis protein
VVIISADAMQSQINRLLIAGAKSYLTKPIDLLMFLKMVDEWI